jgi:hypothetical protein
MTTCPPPSPGRSWRTGFLYLFVPGTFFLLGCLVTWLVLQRRNDSVMVGLPVPAGTALRPGEPTPQPDEPGAAPEIFRDNFGEVSGAAATLVGIGCNHEQGLVMDLALLKAGDRQHLWRLEETDMALPLSPALLERVIDGQPIAMLPSFRARGGQGQVPDLANFNDYEALAFCEALYKANLASTGAFANSARRDLTFSDLFSNPRKYRGQVVHFEGRLRRVRHTDPPPNARAKGVDHLYEAWVFDPHRYGVNPVCLVFTERPAGLAVAEQLDQPVQFDAYFFKKYRYQSADSKPGFAREAPLFIGRSPVLETTPSAMEAPMRWNTSLLVLFLVLVLATVWIAFALHWWFRRGDRRVQARLQEVRQREFVDPGLPNLPGPSPSNN